MKRNEDDRQAGGDATPVGRLGIHVRLAMLEELLDVVRRDLAILTAGSRPPPGSVCLTCGWPITADGDPVAHNCFLVDA